MLFIIGSFIAFIALLLYGIYVFNDYKSSTKEEKKTKHRHMIRVVLMVPITAILLISENLRRNGLTLEEIRPYLFVAVLISFFIPGFVYMLRTAFHKESREKFNDRSHYKSSFVYKYRKVIVPLAVLVPIVFILVMFYQIWEMSF
ncbi:hypothetical protein N780_08655 [Pontibacillus chungwhensis BH030062]|uniref:Uncharacterized protein n=1 Tax=Pontibacillus chungwhensis BH030062 TaxID=1385513 RepID=A0A0A2UTU4_9BACI|nr:OSTA/TMEM184 family protein [Pontibacillus chungwhensis]KGP91324.1 hypothetical protein N780_08655 [Pontibacillus chungwhensis BH030062]